MPANVWKRDVSGTPKQSQAQGASVASYKTADVAGGQASACDAPAAKRQHVQQHAAYPQHQQATQAAPAVAPPHQKGMFSKHEQPEGRAAGSREGVDADAANGSAATSAGTAAAAAGRHPLGGRGRGGRDPSRGRGRSSGGRLHAGRGRGPSTQLAADDAAGGVTSPPNAAEQQQQQQQKLHHQHPIGGRGAPLSGVRGRGHGRGGGRGGAAPPGTAPLPATTLEQRQAAAAAAKEEALRAKQRELEALKAAIAARQAKAEAARTADAAAAAAAAQRAELEQRKSRLNSAFGSAFASAAARAQEEAATRAKERAASSTAEQGGADAAEVSRVLSAVNDYAVLGLRPGCDGAAIKRRYRELAVRLHPDKCSASNAAAAFQRLHAAYQALRAFVA